MVRLGFMIGCLLLIVAAVPAQNLQRCASVERLERKFRADKYLQLHFEQQRGQFNKSIESGYFVNRGNAARLQGTFYVIPVVVHIVLTDPSSVTDEEVADQLDVLNQAFAGTSADSVSIPAHFEGVKGKSILQFCLAQRTPEGLPTNGIHRVGTTRTSFSSASESVKYTASGGADSWNPEKYMNIWITSLSGGILGYSSFPEDGSPQEQGIVIDHRALPGGLYSEYDRGKTLVHEAGHFFDLYHIWGDDNGSCSGTDFIDDTPPQANSSTACKTDKVFDQCTSAGSGIMYQNYMDYTPDECLVLFTAGQVMRMEAAATTYLFSLLNSDYCMPLNLPDNDVGIKRVDEPGQRLCLPGFKPTVTIENLGTDTLRSLRVQAVLDSRDTVKVDWEGELAYKDSATIELPSFTAQEGAWLIRCSIENRNGSNTDENAGNDTLSAYFQYYPAVQELSESFEDELFPPRGWDVVDIPHSTGWKKTSDMAASGHHAAVVDNISGESITSLLRPIAVNLRQMDSAWLSFSYAGAPDTFAVLVSLDCGETYTSIYNNLQRTSILQAAREESLEWTKDSVNISAYINKGDLLFAFSTSFSDAGKVYLDDITIRKVIINPNLKSTGFLVTPNPVSGNLTVQFYPQPTGLKRIVLYSVTGQVVKDIITGSSSSYIVDVSSLSGGMYIVCAVFADRTLYKKIIKQ